MPAARRAQNNSMLYAVVAFVGISIIAIVVAVVFYIKYEDTRTNLQQTQADFRELVSNRDWRRITALVGDKKTNETYVGKLNEYLDQAVILLVGGPLEETSAQVKLQNAVAEVNSVIAPLAQPPFAIEPFDMQTTGLVRVVELLAQNVKAADQALIELKDKLDEHQKNFSEAKKVWDQTEKQLRADVARFKAQADSVAQKYHQLEQKLNDTSKQRIDDVIRQRDSEIAKREALNNELLRTRAQLEATQQKLENLQQQIWKLQAPPDKQIAAFKSDGRVILVDGNIIHINLGRANHVYPGLTFAVYDKSAPITADGRGKAEIQVYDVKENVSAARVIRSEKRKPIVEDDVVANLIWDSQRRNLFTVAGDFDLDGDGAADYDGIEKISKLIRQWGGSVADSVSIDTDFVVLGKPPMVLRKPTIEETELDPTAEQKYQDSLKKRAHYDEVLRQAQNLWVPMLNFDRFLYFIGYKSLSDRPDAFS